MGRARKNNVQLTVYISPKSKWILERLKEGRTPPGDTPEATKNVKDGFQLSAETERLLETLQRDSKDRGDKKSKGWFIDQALDHYVSKGGDKLFRQLEKEQKETGGKKSKGWFVEQALQKKYNKK